MAGATDGGGNEAGTSVSELEPLDDDKEPLHPSKLFAADALELDPDVNLAIQEAFQSTDPLDDPNFDTVKHINSLFPNEQSLANLDPFVAKLKVKIRRIDTDIQTSVRGQSSTDESNQTLIDAQAGMAELFQRIQDIRTKAETSEKMVQEITRDIKSLDYAKKHLTTSIRTLNHLKMVVGGVDSLEALVKHRQYRDAANVLSAMLNVLEHFEQYKEIGRIMELNTKVEDIREQLATQITLEFKKAFRRPELDRDADVATLSESCAVMDVLGAPVKEKFVGWFVNLQLRDYRSTFGPQEEAAWLDKIDRRYAWLKRQLAAYNESCQEVFPENWHLAEVIADRFVEITKEELTQIIAERRDQLDVKLLLFAMKKSSEFESYLVQKFPSREYVEETPEAEADPRGRASTMERGDRRPPDSSESSDVRSRYQRYQQQNSRSNVQEERKRPRRLKKNKFIGKVSNIFESCMDVYVDAQDTHLETMMEAFVKSYRENGVQTAGDDEDDGKTLDSSGDMFRHFRECIITCTQLNSKQAIFDLHLVFRKHLKIYCETMLVANLPKSAQLATIILKDGDIKLTPEEQYVTCCILNTAEYCLDTTSQLEEKLKQKVDMLKEDEVDLNEEQDSFHKVISNAIQLLVRALETQCDAALTAMTKTKWDQIEEVGDTSLYVSQMGKMIAQMVPFVRSSINNTRKYFNNFCMKFASSFIPRLMTHVFKCKNVGTVAGEQLLLDMQMVRMLLHELPSIGSATAKAPPASYTRFVDNRMAKTEMILKIVMAPHEPAQLYVEDYLKLVGEEEGISALQKILDMKGLKKAEQQPILEAYKALAPTVSNDKAASGSSQRSLTSKVGAAVSGGKGNKSILKLQRLMKRIGGQG